ncbi:MAG: beta-ketoacyl-[acyl-carrier-protein] synthase family protein [Sulfurimonas sp.]|nr:beta-ketoacyl-[acyl-carrier-protein] synthase family protein [Sulfurimonas sp.]
MKAYINSYESMSCAGDTQALMNAIYSKKSAISIDTTYMNETPVGLGKMEYDDFFKILEDVVKTVLDNSNLENFNNTLLIVGSSVGGMAESEKHYFKDKNYKNIDFSKHAINVIGDYLDEKFSFFDTRSISTACTSSANALLLAKRLINVEAYDNVLVVGADSLCYTTVCGFHALSVLSSKECTPFSKDRDGMNVAEAVAALLIQNVKTDESIELLGVGASSDAYHMTNPDPEAKGAISSMQKALDDAGIKPSDIDYINAHGTGTMANDKVEALAIETLFDNVYMSSTKAIIGHTLGAAGAIEAIISCESIKRGLIIPQTSMIDVENKNINIPQELIKKEINYVISNSFAFGGNNTSIVFGVLK